MKSPSHGVLAAGLGMFLSVSVDADLIYSNYDGVNVSSFAASVDYFQIFNGEFMGTRWATFAGIVPAGTWTLSYLEVNIERLSGSSDDLRFYLYDGEPSSQNLIAELASSSPIDVQASYALYPTVPATITGGTRLNVVVQPEFVPDTWFAWRYAPGETGSDYSEASGTTWGPWETGADALTVRVYADEIPEPAT